MEVGEFIGYAIAVLGSGGITHFVHWRIDKRKGDASVKSDEIENIRKTMESVYQPIIKQQNDRIDELTKEVKQLRDDKRKMEQAYQEQIAALQKQIVEINRALGLNAQKAIRDKRTGQFISPKKEEEKK